MYLGKRILAVVPARGGSKGIPLKNIYPLAGKPLIGWTGDFLRKIDWIDLTIVSTDHKSIAETAVQYGIECPFMRPDSLSGSRIGDWDVLHHALTESEKKNGVEYDIVLMFQPTSPFRKIKDIEQSISMIVEGKYDSVWSVSATDTKNHPLKQLTVKEDHLRYYDEAGKTIIARQQLVPTYQRNGVVYAITRSCLLDRKSIYGENPAALVIEGVTSNIDEILDVQWAEFLLEKKVFAFDF